MIELDGVVKRFGHRNALDGFSLRCEPGEITVLIGPSGCGKTTALKLMNRLLEPDAGLVLLRDRPAAELDPVDLRRGIGYAIQEVGLFPHYRVFDNIAVVPRLLGWSEKRIEKRVRELLGLVTLDASYARLYPAELSGGERQRVGLARALGADPDILLMDEPFGAIDPINRGRLHATLLEIQERLRKTIVIVTHDIDEAIKLGDRIAVLREGRLVRLDTPARLLQEPGDDFVAGLLGPGRNLKTLALRRARDAVQTEGYLTVTPNEDPTLLRDRLIQAGLIVAFAVDERARLAGRYFLDEGSRDRPCRSDAGEPLHVARNANLQEVLVLMLESGEQLLPVVGPDGEFLGALGMKRMFAEATGGNGEDA